MARKGRAARRRDEEGGGGAVEQSAGLSRFFLHQIQADQWLHSLKCWSLPDFRAGSGLTPRGPLVGDARCPGPRDAREVRVADPPHLRLLSELNFMQILKFR